MAFFKELKEKLENTIVDLATTEHALIVEENDEIIYRFQQIGGDSLSYFSEDLTEKEYFELFNEAFLASTVARTDLSRFIIECLTK